MDEYHDPATPTPGTPRNLYVFFDGKGRPRLVPRPPTQRLVLANPEFDCGLAIQRLESIKHERESAVAQPVP